MRPGTWSRSACIAVAFTMLVPLPPVSADAADAALPVIHGEKTLATVNGEPITLKSYSRQFASIHEGSTDKDPVAKKDPAEILERMIKGMLVVQEAETMGLGEVPDVQAVLEQHRQETLRDFLFGDRVRRIRKADPAEVDRIYRASVMEIRGASVLMNRKEDAEALLSAVRNGGDFAGLVAKAVEEGKGEGSREGGFVRVSELPPDVARIASGLKAGEVGPVLGVGKKFTIMKVDAIRFPEDAAKRSEAARDALRKKRSDALRSYVKSLQKKYVKRDESIIKTVDFEAETPGFATLLKDRRPVARIAGESPVTVGDWAESLNRIFFHGIDQAIRQKQLNGKKEPALEQILAKRVVLKEAKRKGVDRSAPFKERIAEFRSEVLFGAFVQKVIEPECRATDEELKAYLKAHIAEYTVPESIRFEFLAFTRKEDAEDAIGKLRNGADFQWMRANATGQADPSGVKELLEVNGMPVYRSDLPDGLGQTLAGVGKGDLRLHASPGGRYCVVVVRDLIPSRPMEFDAVKDRIEKRVVAEKRRKTLEDWMEKLRKGSRVEVHAKGEQLRRLLEEQAW